MSILGGVYTFLGPIVGAFLLQLMDADITKDYPEIWQLFLGGILVLILYGLPGGIMGFIQARDLASSDDDATRRRKVMDEFRRKFWSFFTATLFFTGFFSLLKAPAAWMSTLLLTAGQAVVGLVLFPWMLRRLTTGAPVWRAVFLLFPVLPLALHIMLHTPLSGLMLVVLWAVFIHSYLWQADVRRAFGQPHQMAPRAAPQAP
jgi:TRAP-type C4-dicarboxylate transport system permease large subunit